MSDIRTIGELREFLASYPNDMRVILSADEEGNDYSPLADADERMYVARQTWCGDTYLTPEQLQEEMKKYPTQWTEEDKAPEGAERVIVLYPLN